VIKCGAECKIKCSGGRHGDPSAQDPALDHGVWLAL